MNLLNNKFFIIGLVLVLVIGLLVLAQLMDRKTITGPVEFETTNPQYNIIKNDIILMSQSNWNRTVYSRIKNNIDDYFDTKQIDLEMRDNLKKLLLKKYLLKLTEATEEFCQKSADMNLWNELYTESSNFSSDPDMNQTIALLNDYKYIRNTTLAAENYGKNEKYDETKSKNFESIINKFNNNEILKNNPTLIDEANSALVALGRVSGLNNKFNKADFNNCDCYIDFGKNEYYKAACLEKQ